MGTSMGQDGTATALTLDKDGRILFASGEPAFGFMLDQTGFPSGRMVSLAMPNSILKATQPSEIIYGCNLPLPQEGLCAGDKLLNQAGCLASRIDARAELEFLGVSFPGGQTDVVSDDGGRQSLAFRWACISFDASIGSVWRCYTQTRSQGKRSTWTAIEYDYFFDAAGELMNGPRASLMADAGKAGRIEISHPKGALTQFPCALQRVKVTSLKTNSRVKRMFKDLKLLENGGVWAFFSDGSRKLIATAAPSSAKLSRAA